MHTSMQGISANASVIREITIASDGSLLANRSITVLPGIRSIEVANDGERMFITLQKPDNLVGLLCEAVCLTCGLTANLWNCIPKVIPRLTCPVADLRG